MVLSFLLCGQISLKLWLPEGNSCEKFFNPGGGLDKMIDYWKPYVTDSRYKKIDGKPAFYIYNNGIRGICQACQSSPFFPCGYNTIDAKVGYMLSYMEQRFLGAGNEMYYLATVAPPTIDVTVRDDAVINYPVAGGYDATTTYGYKYWNTTSYTTYTYSTMQGIYNTYYDHILAQSPLKYEVPVTAGWSEGPRNKKYCDDPNDGIPCPGAASPSNGYHPHPIDNAISNPTSFRESLISARNTLLNNPSKTNKVITICCWNEYEEGSYIEPTGDGGQYGWGYQYLQKVSEVFATLNCLDGYYTINGATNNIGTGNIINTGYTSARVVCDNATSYTWTKTSGSLSYTSNGPNAYFTMTSGQSISFIVTAKNSSNQVIGSRNIAFYNFGSFAAYPNPSSEILNIEVNEDLAPDIILLDERQKKIKEVKKYKTKSGIDISTLKPGTYFLHVYLEDKLVNSQQIKIEK